MQNYTNMAEMNILNVCCHQKTTYTFYGIEEHLKQFRDSGQFKILYDSWMIEKEMYKKRLSTVGMTYQTYSLHDASHAEAILRQIAYFLGEDRVRQLSPTDAWLILESAYCHDLGMIVTAKDLYNELAVMTSDAFNEISQRMYQSENYHIRESWNYLEPLFRYGRHRNQCKDDMPDTDGRVLYYADETKNAEKISQLFNLISIYNSNWYEWPMYFTQAFRLLIQEYCRPKHAEMSYRVISREADDKTYEGLIPIRFRYLIAEIAALHMDERENILRLSHKIQGFEGDYAHPRYIAELIRIGDLLDMDNNRFNNYQLAVAGQFSYNSFAHQLKHKALRDFLITPKKIEVKANFTTDDAIRLLQEEKIEESRDEEEYGDTVQSSSGAGYERAVRLTVRAIKEMRGWLEWLRKEVDFFAKNWFQIVPDGLNGSCPCFESEVLLWNGNSIDAELLDLRYEITPKRSSEIIEGNGLYKQRFHAFIREILQNSMDATKRKIYQILYKTHKSFSDPLSFFQYIFHDMNQFMIQVTCTEDTKNKGLRFEIRDYGIGVSRECLKRMQYIGDIRDFKTIQSTKYMPDWWKPTGAFGIGMQTIFQFSKTFKLTTRTEDEKILRKMQFYSTKFGGKIDSYVIEDDSEAESFGYGTKVEVCIPAEMLKLLQKDGQYGKQSDFFEDTLSVANKKIFSAINDIKGNFGIPVVIMTTKENMDQSDITEYQETEHYLEKYFGIYFIDINSEQAKRITKVPIQENGLTKRRQYECNGFSCWNDEKKIFLRYHWNTAGQWRSAIKIYFNEIRVEDEICEQLRIPFLDVEVYLFDGNAENYLEVNREGFLYEMRRPIENMINSTHLSCLRFLLEPEEDGKLSQEKLAIWKEDGICRDNVREYFEYLLYGKVMTRLVQGVHCFIQNAANIYHLSDSAIANEIVSKDSDLWLTDASCKYIGDVHIVQGEQIRVRYIIEDLFLPYMELAVTEMICMREEYGDYTVIYKVGARTGAPLSLSSNSFRSYIRMRYSELHENNIESPRMILPGIEDYRVLCVVRLQNNLGSVFEKKWNSAIIMPLTQNEWEELVEKVEEEKKAEAARIQKDTKKTGGKARTEEEIVQSMINKAYINDSNSSYVEIVKYILSNGISRDATKDRINNAYRRLLMQIWKIFH